MCRKSLSEIYSLLVSSGHRRSEVLEQSLNVSDVPNNIDGRLNESIYYNELFHSSNRGFFERFYWDTLKKMRGISYEDAEQFVDALEIVQFIVSVAMWKYKLDVGDNLRAFARSFDRIDLPEERYRLYLLAQAAN